MFRKLVAASSGACVVALAGCYSAPIMPPVGVVYTNIEAPITGAVTAPRRGEASTTAIAALFAWGDASLKSAAADGGISKITAVDYEYYNFLGIYQSFTTIAYGE